MQKPKVVQYNTSAGFFFMIEKWTMKKHLYSIKNIEDKKMFTFKIKLLLYIQLYIYCEKQIFKQSKKGAHF